MNKFFIVTSGTAYLTEDGTSISMHDAKLFDSMIEVEIALYESNLDLFYWYVKII
ncbi:MAG: hypothetical protein VZR54_08765 [Ruminococcus sp.]|nr:hypothetical protein [Ruminococcus sp.]